MIWIKIHSRQKLFRKVLFVWIFECYSRWVILVLLLIILKMQALIFTKMHNFPLSSFCFRWQIFFLISPKIAHFERTSKTKKSRPNDLSSKETTKVWIMNQWLCMTNIFILILSFFLFEQNVTIRSSLTIINALFLIRPKKKKGLFQVSSRKKLG